jgi:hypothetical protein
MTGGSTTGSIAPAPADAAAARLAHSLDGWRRRMVRRRVIATGRRWALIAACAAGAGATAGHLDGQVVLTAAAAGSAAMAGGIAAMALARRVPLAAAAREMDAALALDEQVATALWYARTRQAGGNPLATGLVERAAGLAARAERQARRDDPRYGEWLAVAVTAAATATVVAAPYPPATPAPSAAQSRHGPGGGHAAGPANSALRAGQARGAAPERRRPAGQPAGARSPSTGTGAPRGGSSPSPATRGASAGAAPRGSAPAAGPGGHAGSTVAGGTNSGGTNPNGTGPSGAARSAPSPANAGNQRAAGSGGPPPAGNAAATTQGGTRPGGAQQGGARPGGATAGTTPGDSRRASGPAQFALPAGGKVALIVVPGTDGSVTGPAGSERGTGTPAGNGGSAAVTTVSPGSADGAGYVPPDGNEVPFWGQVLLGRYF